MKDVNTLVWGRLGPNSNMWKGDLSPPNCPGFSESLSASSRDSEGDSVTFIRTRSGGGRQRGPASRCAAERDTPGPRRWPEAAPRPAASLGGWAGFSAPVPLASGQYFTAITKATPPTTQLAEARITDPELRRIRVRTQLSPPPGASPAARAQLHPRASAAPRPRWSADVPRSLPAPPLHLLVTGARVLVFLDKWFSHLEGCPAPSPSLPCGWGPCPRVSSSER